MLTLYGVVVITFMMLMYAFENRGSQFVLLFAFGCAFSSSYGFLSGAWPFGVVEGHLVADRAAPLRRRAALLAVGRGAPPVM